MKTCEFCGDSIEWITSEGRRIPLHSSGQCSQVWGESLNPRPAFAPCPRCGVRAWLVRNNGGSFWVDELGPPWPKHPCFTDVFHGSPSFLVGAEVWQHCDFCSIIVAESLYVEHLKERHASLSREQASIPQPSGHRHTVSGKWANSCDQSSSQDGKQK